MKFDIRMNAIKVTLLDDKGDALLNYDVKEINISGDIAKLVDTFTQLLTTIQSLDEPAD